MEFSQFYRALNADDVNAITAKVGEEIMWKLTVSGERALLGTAVLLAADPFPGHPLDLDLKFDVDPGGEALLSAIDDAQDEGMLWLKFPPLVDFEMDGRD